MLQLPHDNPGTLITQKRKKKTQGCCYWFQKTGHFGDTVCSQTIFVCWKVIYCNKRKWQFKCISTKISNMLTVYMVVHCKDKYQIWNKQMMWPDTDNCPKLTWIFCMETFVFTVLFVAVVLLKEFWQIQFSWLWRIFDFTIGWQIKYRNTILIPSFMQTSFFRHLTVLTQL